VNLQVGYKKLERIYFILVGIEYYLSLAGAIFLEMAIVHPCLKTILATTVCSIGYFVLYEFTYWLYFRVLERLMRRTQGGKEEG
jgi:hypothetical protein